MDDESKTDLFDALVRVCGACEGLPTRNRLQVLQLAWLILASNARAEALVVVPGGFPEEKARQLRQLRKMADLVGADESDLGP
jgi:hypothetical protein